MLTNHWSSIKISSSPTWINQPWIIQMMTRKGPHKSACQNPKERKETCQEAGIRYLPQKVYLVITSMWRGPSPNGTGPCSNGTCSLQLMSLSTSSRNTNRRYFNASSTKKMSIGSKSNQWAVTIFRWCQTKLVQFRSLNWCRIWIERTSSTGSRRSTTPSKAWSKRRCTSPSTSSTLSFFVSKSIKDKCTASVWRLFSSPASLKTLTSRRLSSCARCRSSSIYRIALVCRLRWSQPN